MMPGFKSFSSYGDFAREIKRHSRFIRSQETEDFLLAVSGTVQPRQATLPAGKTLCRAQVGYETVRRVDEDHEFDEELPFGRDRMVPQSDRAREGRVNPQGIPCLYLAINPETALAEVRPGMDSLVSVGFFKTLRDLLIVDCSWYPEHPGFLHHLLNTPWDEIDEPDKEPEPAALERAAWGDIDHAFARPVTRSDDAADYAPTQVLAELFKSKGMDGLVYKSALREDGYNIALFDLEAAKIHSCQLYQVEKIRYSSAKYGSPWYLRPE